MDELLYFDHIYHKCMLRDIYHVQCFHYFLSTIFFVNINLNKICYFHDLLSCYFFNGPYPYDTHREKRAHRTFSITTNRYFITLFHIYKTRAHYLDGYLFKYRFNCKKCRLRPILIVVLSRSRLASFRCSFNVTTDFRTAAASFWRNLSLKSCVLRP